MVVEISFFSLVLTIEKILNKTCTITASLNNTTTLTEKNIKMISFIVLGL